MEQTGQVVSPSTPNMQVDLGYFVLKSPGPRSSPVYDLGCTSVGTAELRLTSTTPTKLRLVYGPRLDLMHFWTELETTSAGDQQVPVAVPQIALRYFRVELDADASQIGNELCLNRFTLESSSWDERPSGSLDLGDDELNQIVAAAVRTNQLCVVPGLNTLKVVNRPGPAEPDRFKTWSSPPDFMIVDGPRRDMEAWIGDVRVQALALYYSHGAYDIARDTIRHFARLQAPSGRIPGSSASLQQFASYVLWWIVSLWEYFLHSGDLGLLTETEENFAAALAWVRRRVNDDGEFVGDRDWMWTVARAPSSPAIQAVFCYAMDCAAKIARELGRDRDAASAESAAREGRSAFARLSANRADGAIHERIQVQTDRNPVFQDNNCLPIVFGLEGGESAYGMLGFLRRNMWTKHGSLCTDVNLLNPRLPDACTYYDIYPVTQRDLEVKLPELAWAHTRQVWPFANAYEVEARLIVGDVEGAIELTRRCWSTFVREPPGTCWEMVDGETGRFPTHKFLVDSSGDTYDSACHGWSGWISYVLAARLLGVRPLTPGFGETLVQPLPNDLPTISGTVPTPHGPILVNVARRSTECLVSVDSPGDVRITCDLSKLESAGLKPRVVEKSDD